MSPFLAILELPIPLPLLLDKPPLPILALLLLLLTPMLLSLDAQDLSLELGPLRTFVETLSLEFKTSRLFHSVETERLKEMSNATEETAAQALANSSHPPLFAETLLDFAISSRSAPELAAL